MNLSEWANRQGTLEAHGRSPMVIDHAEVDRDLLRDMTEILMSFCARLYGPRAPAPRAQRAWAAATSSSEVDESAA